LWLQLGWFLLFWILGVAGESLVANGVDFSRDLGDESKVVEEKMTGILARQSQSLRKSLLGRIHIEIA
jgi:hypothetical protein